MHTPTLRAALFDLDGTLLDTESQYTVFWRRTARHYRPDVLNLEYAIKGTTLTQIFSNYFPDAGVQAEITNALNEWERTMQYTFVPGALGFLQDLKAHSINASIQECVVFEDAPNGLQAGKSSGIMTMGLTTGLTAEQIKDKCDHVIPDFTHLSYEKTIALLSDFWKKH